VTIEVQQDVTGETVPTVVPVARRTRWRSLLRTRKMRIGLGIVVFFALVAVIGPLVISNAGQIGDEGLGPPSGGHPLGTTNTGQDVLKLLIVSARGSLTVGLTVGILATVVSILIGVVGAYAGGRYDEGLSLFSNVFLVLPGLPLVILLTDYLQSRGAVAVAAIISLTGWAGAARVLRAQTLSVRNRDYVDAARVSGEPAWRIIVSEVLPNLLPIIAAQFIFAVLGGILIEAALAFLGLGGSSSWGSMLFFAQNAQALSLGAWWWFVPPGLCIALFGCGLALINFSLDELINPRLVKA
jgi:peptide/nickel transport system permease protein